MHRTHVHISFLNSEVINQNISGHTIKIDNAILFIFVIRLVGTLLKIKQPPFFFISNQDITCWLEMTPSHLQKQFMKRQNSKSLIGEWDPQCVF